jgi:hypothetical protein
MRRSRVEFGSISPVARLADAQPRPGNLEWWSMQNQSMQWPETDAGSPSGTPAAAALNPFLDPSNVAGRKDDAGKPRMDLIPPSILTALGTVLDFGARKYGVRNWEKGIAYGRVFAALMRHLWAWWGREAADSETGYSHLWHAVCCIAFLVEFEQHVANGVGVLGGLPGSLDDRPGVVA